MLMLVGYHLVRGMALRLTEKMHYGVTVITNLLVPTEVASFMPVAMASPVRDSSPISSPVQNTIVPPTTNEGAAPDGNSASNTAENIRDEEEII
jgi:hypothetical protein